MKFILILIIFSALPAPKFGPNALCILGQHEEFSLKIDQTVFDAYRQYRFSFSKKRFDISENFINKKGQLLSNKVYSAKLNSINLHEIIRLSDTLYSLKQNYIKEELGGIQWNIKLELDGKSKEIIVENIYVPSIDSLFIAINKIIPQGKPKIYMLNQK